MPKLLSKCIGNTPDLRWTSCVVTSVYALLSYSNFKKEYIFLPEYVESSIGKQCTKNLTNWQYFIYNSTKIS